MGHNTQKIFNSSNKWIGWESEYGKVYWGHNDWYQGVGKSTYPHLNYNINGVKGHLFLKDKIVNSNLWNKFSNLFGL